MPSPQPGRVVVLVAPAARVDDLLLDGAAPRLRALLGAPGAAPVFFHRSVKPSWSVRLFVGGRDAARHAARPGPRGGATAIGIEPPDDEVELVAGPRTAALRACFQVDSVLVLDVLALKRSGRLERTPREFALLFAERLLDALALDDGARREFHRRGFAGPLEQETWRTDDLARLDARFDEIGAPLARLVEAARGECAPEAWGGAEAALLARAALAAYREPLDLAVRGSGTDERIEIADLLVARHANRLGIDGLGQAVVRYLAWRLHGGAPAGG